MAHRQINMQIIQIFWILFFVFIAGAVFFDLFWLGKRQGGALSLKKAGFWTAGWIFLALLFNFSIYIFLGSQKALEFSTAYILEYSLSIDNLFIFLVIFSFDSRIGHSYLIPKMRSILSLSFLVTLAVRVICFSGAYLPLSL